LRHRLRVGAVHRAQACTWEATVDRFEEICEEAVQSHRRSLRLPRGSWTGPDHRVPVDEYQNDDAASGVPPELAGIPVGTGRPTLQVVRDRPDLTIVLPAFNEAARLPMSIPQLTDHLRSRSERVEVIIVDDGSSDDTVSVATDLLEGLPNAGVYKLGRHAGKGAAVRAGIARATGESIVFMDADLATDLRYLDPLLAALGDVHIAVGSRSAPGAVTSGITPSSDAAHRVFNMLARSVTGLEFTDFQCGFKGFRASTAKLLFHLMRERGYAFDVELLILADKIGFDVREIPVHWQAVRGSHVRIVVDSVNMTGQLVRIGQRRRHGQGFAALEAWGRSPDMPVDDVIEAVRGALPVSAPVVPWEKGAVALLPFVQPVDATDLAHLLERNLDGILVRATSIEAGEVLDPANQAMRRALTSP